MDVLFLTNLLNFPSPPTKKGQGVFVLMSYGQKGRQQTNLVAHAFEFWGLRCGWVRFLAVVNFTVLFSLHKSSSFLCSCIVVAFCCIWSLRLLVRPYINVLAFLEEFSVVSLCRCLSFATSVTCSKIMRNGAASETRTSLKVTQSPTEKTANKKSLWVHIARMRQNLERFCGDSLKQVAETLENLVFFRNSRPLPLSMIPSRVETPELRIRPEFGSLVAPAAPLALSFHSKRIAQPKITLCRLNWFRVYLQSQAPGSTPTSRALGWGAKCLSLGGAHSRVEPCILDLGISPKPSCQGQTLDLGSELDPVLHF